jgi:hypothetical protein
MDAWQPYIESIFKNERVECYQQNQELDIESYLSIAYRRLRGIASVLQEKIRKDPISNRILTEITITNVDTRHEGRVDVIFEYPNSVETIDWKTYSDDNKMSSSDRLQILLNGMLVNYRYGRVEDDFRNNQLTLITSHKIHHPRPTTRAMDKIRSARTSILRILAGERGVQTQFPHPSVCNSQTRN